MDMNFLIWTLAILISNQTALDQIQTFNILNTSPEPNTIPPFIYYAPLSRTSYRIC